MELKELLPAEYRKRENYLKANRLEAFRLFCADNRHLFSIDLYKDNAVVHLFDRINDATFRQLEDVLKVSYAVKDIFYKDRTRQELKLPECKSKSITVTEYGNKFLINLSDYLDVGLFLDHRETRKWLEPKCKNKVVLNTFAYTGSFSIYAARGGAERTYSVDLSKTYCEWIKKNLELNGLPPEKNWVYKMDTLEFFSYAGRKGLKFDIIIIDPPTFSKNKKKNFSVQRDHPALINAALELLNDGGFIMFSNNCTDFRLATKEINSTSIRRLNLIPVDFAGQKPHISFIIGK